MPRNAASRIQDMLDAIDRAMAHVGGSSFEEFAANPTVGAAVSYELLILGEAAGRVPDEIVSAHPEIPWGQLRGTRNVLVHVYFEISRATLWQTIRADLPPLAEKLRRLLE